MINPVQSHEALLADIQRSREDGGRLHVWWFGQSGFLVQWEGRHLLFDPYLSDSLTRKYAQTDKPHVRMTELVIDPRRLDFVDVVTSSHNHTDHLDAETLQSLLAANPEIRILVPDANCEFAAERLGVGASRLDAIDVDGTIELCGFTVHAVPAAHETIELDDQGRSKYLGYVVEVGDRVLYHSGDTVLYEGMADRLRPWKIDLAFLPINGRLPERRVAGNLWGREAAQLARDAGMGCIIPCHYEMFEFNTAPVDEFVETCKRIQQPYRVLKAGERYSF